MWVPAHLCLSSSRSACHLGTPTDSKMMLYGVCPAERLSGSPLQGRSRSHCRGGAGPTTGEEQVPLQGRGRSHCRGGAGAHYRGGAGPTAGEEQEPTAGEGQVPLQGRSRSHCMLALICSDSLNLRYLA